MKNRSLTTVSCCFLLFFAISHSAVNFPYPQKKSYGNGTINVGDLNAASTTLKSKFTSFLSTHYEPGTCSGKPCARIKWDETDKTVSEGIGYGMLMMVYFSDASTSYQDNFDRLWAYYQNFPNERGLMRWKTQGFSSYIEPNAASDAEFDVATALVMAHYQFGSTSSKNYLDTAKALIAKIRQHEISSNNLHKPGDVWDEVRNPSYISPAAFEIFREVEGLSTSKAKWQSVITANYTLLKANQNSNGLFSDWCTDAGAASDNKGSTNSPSGYSYDAARVPWRVAWANAWYNHADAKTILTKVNTYLNNREPNNTGYADNSTFVGPFTNALSTSSNQTKMNTYWTKLMGFSGEAYYSKALQVITGLLATGNMPNLKALANDNCCTGGGTVQGNKIDKLESAENESIGDRNFARTWEPWYVFTDASSDNGTDGRGASTIKNEPYQNTVWNKTAEKCETITDYNVIIKDGSDWVAKIDRYEFKQGDYKWESYASIGLDAVNNGSSYDFKNCPGGFQYKYKGAVHNFKAQLRTVKDYAYHTMQIPTASTNWTTVDVPTSELEQESWGVKVPFNLSQIDAFTWEVKDGLSTKTGSLAIKDFFCMGGTLPFPAEKPESKCGSGGSPSSSSVRSSSSAGSGGASSSSVRSSSSAGSVGASSSSVRSSSSAGSVGASSSSVRSSSSAGGVSGTSSSSVRSSSSAGSVGGTSSNSDGGSSTDSGDETSSSSFEDVSPVILSQAVFSNGLNAMQNAVNLQAAGNATIQIFDLKGNAVRTLGFTQGSFVVSMADLPRGLYLVKASSGGWKQTITVPVR